MPSLHSWEPAFLRTSLLSSDEWAAPVDRALHCHQEPRDAHTCRCDPCSGGSGAPGSYVKAGSIALSFSVRLYRCIGQRTHQAVVVEFGEWGGWHRVGWVADAGWRVGARVGWVGFQSQFSASVESTSSHARPQRLSKRAPGTPETTGVPQTWCGENARPVPRPTLQCSTSHMPLYTHVVSVMELGG